MQRLDPMPRVGRNDPCPCGSGKKYKNCHMREQQAQTTSALLLREARDTVYTRLVEFVQGERFLADLGAAMDLFWNGRLHPAQIGQVAPLHRLRAFEFFWFDYRNADGQRLIDLFAAERGARLSPEEKTVLKEWQASYLRVLTLTRPDGETLLLRDTLQGADVRLESNLPPPVLSPGVTLVGRVVAARPAYFLRDVALPLPPARGEALTAYLRPRFAAYQDRHPRAGWPDFLRDESYLVNHYLLEDPDFLPAPPPSPVAQPDVNADLQVAQDIVRQMHGGLIIGSLDQHYASWLDKPVQAWGNRSPRQLLADERGRQRVTLWLDVLEEAEQSRRALGQPAYDVNRLWAQLGLLGPGVM